MFQCRCLDSVCVVHRIAAEIVCVLSEAKWRVYSLAGLRNLFQINFGARAERRLVSFVMCTVNRTNFDYHASHTSQHCSCAQCYMLFSCHCKKLWSLAVNRTHESQHGEYCCMCTCPALLQKWNPKHLQTGLVIKMALLYINHDKIRISGM